MQVEKTGKQQLEVFVDPTDYERFAGLQKCLQGLLTESLDEPWTKIFNQDSDHPAERSDVRKASDYICQMESNESGGNKVRPGNVIVI